MYIRPPLSGGVLEHIPKHENAPEYVFCCQCVLTGKAENSAPAYADLTPAGLFPRRGRGPSSGDDPMFNESTLAHRSSVHWLLSYQGRHTYECAFEGEQFRVEVQIAKERYPEYSNLTQESFERSVNGAVGFVTSAPSRLTTDFIAMFNRLRYEEWSAQVSEMLKQPERFKGFIPEGFKVYVGAVYSPTGWIRLQSFEDVRNLAGIPFDVAIDPTIEIQ